MNLNEKEFSKWATGEAKRLAPKYFISPLRNIEVKVVEFINDPEESAISSIAQVVADVIVVEPYGMAIIRLDKNYISRASKSSVINTIEHEVQHIALFPLDILKNTMKNLIGDESFNQFIDSEFAGANERLRTLIGRLTKRGN